MRGAPRGRTALVAIFAILFQVVLFGWHHHEPSLAGRLTAAIIEKPVPSRQAAEREDRCGICSVLHHLFAETVEFSAAPPRFALAAAPVSGDAASAVSAICLAFRARAPPFA
jgi:hypothetical protein